MRRIVIAASIACVVVIAALGYQEYRIKQVVREVSQMPTNSPNHNVHPHTEQPHYHPPLAAESSIPEQPLEHTPQHVFSDDEDTLALAREQEFENLFPDDEECCPEEESVASSDENGEPLSQYERLKREMIAEHGDLPEIDIYVGLLRKYGNREPITVGEDLTFHELLAQFKPEYTAVYEEMKQLYANDDRSSILPTVYRNNASLGAGSKVELSSREAARIHTSVTWAQ